MGAVEVVVAAALLDDPDDPQAASAPAATRPPEAVTPERRKLRRDRHSPILGSSPPRPTSRDIHVKGSSDVNSRNHARVSLSPGSFVEALTTTPTTRATS